MKNSIKLLSVILSLSLLSVMLCGCSRKEPSPRDSVINYYIPYEPETLDPQIVNDSVADMIIMNIYEGLVRLDEHEDIIPGAAASWEISSDKLRYDFHLRSDLKWSDGEALNAEDFVFGLRRSVAKETASPTAKTLSCIKNAEIIQKGEAPAETLGISAPDSRTVHIELDYPDTALLTTLTTPPAMPCRKDFFEGSIGQYGRVDDKILSNGAFTIQEGQWDSGTSIYLSRNEYYTGEADPIPAGVRLSVDDSITDHCQAIIDGKTDCGTVQNTDIEKARKNKLHITAFGDTVHGITFNTENDILKNTNLRLALLSALNRDELLGALADDCTRTETLIPAAAELENQSYRKVAGNIQFQPDSNPALLLRRGLKELDMSSFPELTILCTNDETTQSVVSNLIESWNGFTGAYLNKKPVSEEELQSRIRSGSYQIAIAPLKTDSTTPLGTLEAFHSASQKNVANYHSEEYDRLLDELKKNVTLSAADQFAQAEQLIISQALYYPLYTQNRYYASAENVEHIIFHPHGENIDFMSAVKTEE